jgi:valine--pyruvate aminotransferase
MMEISKFGKKIATVSGIGQLMDDLGSALVRDKGLLMLGGGNPAHIPEVQKCFRECTQRLLERSGEFERAIGDYDPSAGNKPFREAVAELLSNQFGWDVGVDNIALTNGSQSAFFILFNIFGGQFEDGLNKKILLPLTPEYIGYCDVGISEGLFVAERGVIEFCDEHIFKYHIDFDKLKVDESIGGICVSRPTNPSGNVLTDAEIEQLSELAADNDIPLIIDNAYGTPFPNIIFTEARPYFGHNTIVCMSLSKLGLPSTRTGIVIAAEEIIDMISKVNAIVNLSPPGLGAAIATELVRTGKIIELSRKVIKPFYEKKAALAIEQLKSGLDGVDFYIHKPEGAFFLWLWLKGLPVSCEQLYRRLKKRGVIVVPGHYFFPGLKDHWKHKDECLRISYAQNERVVTEGLKIISEEIKRAYKV